MGETARRARLSPAEVTEQSMPGIGRRFDLPLGDDQSIVTVIHHSGRRDLYVLAAGHEEPAATASLSDAQARTLSAILGGAYFKPSVVEEIESVVGGLLIDWVTVSEDSRGAGQSIADLEIRRHTGMTVAAIVRDDDAILAPEPTEVLRAEDRLVVLGRPDDLIRFRRHVIDP
ncbi:MAG: K(+)/H(+) antiporter subunit KhtT [Acidimicrobiales bacterium]|nr:MAG: hypothetical protein EDR02_03145 [Actinomycetota bacterium]MBV6509004.1 K(+)/H(+) antiporter subunit KhtT [Acidimicrobiales bacterium]RIK06282.1 MAG: hypothetical protein DCC48_07600 [Acidobacteriota bacterium]